MRIISGYFKGKKIIQPKDLKTRPLKDLTKESIFNIIVHSNKFSINLKDSNILDLFSGVGSFGLECLSRGSKKVIFIENYEEVLPILKKNINNLKITKNFKILKEDILNHFLKINLKDQFDIIFLDPPYKTKNLSKLLTDIHIHKCLKSNGLVILHRHKKEIEQYPTNFKILEKKVYGISKIIFGLFIN